jgi:hypothetical protein
MTTHLRHQPAPPPTSPPPAMWGPPRQRRRWGRALAATGVLMVAVGATATLTYTLAHSPTQPTTHTPAAAPAGEPPMSAPSYSPAEQTAAKDRACHIFLTANTGLKNQGGIITNGEVNTPVVLRTINGVVALQDALTIPSMPPDFATTVRAYVSAKLDLTVAALDSRTPIDEVNRLNDAANGVTDDMAAACGLGH